MVWALFLGGRNLLTFGQASGRLCRSPSLVGTAVVWSLDGYSYVLTSQSAVERVPNLAALGNFDQWSALPATECRRLWLDATLDGFSRDTFVSCTAGGFARCDYCEEQVRKKRRRESDGAGIMRQSARTATMGDVCCQPRNICKEEPKPWDPNTDGHIDPSISRCDGCCLPRTVRCDETAHDMHGAAHFGPTKCPWTLCIKVVLIQVLLSRAHMSVDKPDFAPALSKACQVEWTTTSGNGSDAPPERLIPNELLVWGPNKRQQGTDAIARWLTSGRKLPNTVLFAPILARAFDLSF
eukprot:contig_2724_g540